MAPFIKRTSYFCPRIYEYIDRLYCVYDVKPENTKNIRGRVNEFFIKGFKDFKLNVHNDHNMELDHLIKTTMDVYIVNR